ncbi:MAG: TRAM domain-containing protein, partial [Clostridiales bacterium]|nr:TRAM domain-containing protein [Clostridiales bacterium]
AKTDEELAELAAAGFDGLTIGIETGDEEALAFMDKGYGAEDIAKRCARLDAAGISYAFFYLVGISGAGRGLAGARATADVCNRTNPWLIGANMLTIYRSSALYREIEAGRWREAAEVEKYEEVKELVAQLDIPVEISSVDYDDVAEVDAKLLRMAKDMGGMVVTNDFNLNKVAAVQGVSVFNINDLSNAVKPVLLPGEELSVTILKEGKENGQGIAYLDDGTMIVVENASSRIGQTLEVAVTSVLQTSAGRMIFAKISE